MVKAVIITGLAGSGKTMLSYSLFEWYHNIKQDVAILNLDPGVTNLPYSPDIDIREYINIWDLMKKYSIGPNGALILGMDMLLDYIERLNHRIGSLNPEILVIDTPGQMEVFAYRVSGKLIVDLFNVDEKLLLFVMDGMFVKDAKNLISNLLVGASVKLRFQIPFLTVLNKIDLLTENEKKNLDKWFKSDKSLYDFLSKHYTYDESEFLLETFNHMKSHRIFTNYIPISAITLDNMDILIQAISRILFKGDEYLEL